MTPDRWQRVKDVFSAASALQVAERRAYLDEACRKDAGLLAEVESLLDAHGQENAIVDRPAAVYVVGDTLSLETDACIGRRIGAYEIVALIAHGGMGDVYRARRVDAQYEKEVAIKLVPGGFQAGFVLQRLRTERQILANLEHPNIARLIDGGATEEGSPYLVMEFVDGRPIDQFVAEHDLSVRERLVLFCDVCAAVTYAHQCLVVHRDLKPGNILVTGDGTVKLLDFGIAKLLQHATPEAGPPPTRTLMQVLTPGFASPEQILGKPITTASDVYSLGVVLYLLLTGRSPYRNTLDTAEDAIRAICDTEPLQPSAADPTAKIGRGERLGRDLDAIILRALRKEPERRYLSVEQFSEDIRRYLGGLPVLARGDRLGYRAGKFLRRRKFEMAAAGLLSLTLVGATVVSLREARIAARQAELAEQQRERAERHFASVRGLANAFMFRVHDAIKDLPGSIEARELLVSTALEYLNALAAEAGTDHEFRLELASAYQKIGDIQGGPNQASKGHARAALDSYAKSTALLEPVVAAEPGNARARTLLAENYQRQSHLLLYEDELRKAADASARGVAMFESLAEMQPDIVTRRALASAYRKHSQNLNITGPPGDASLAYARKAADIMEDLIQQDPDNNELARELASTYSSVAGALIGPEPRPKAVDEALSLYRKALAIDERLVAATGGHSNLHVRDLLFDRILIAQLLYEKGDYQAALENARAAQKLLSILKVDANNAYAQLDGVLVANQLGSSQLALGNVGEAATIFEQNLRAIEKMAHDSDLPAEFVLGETEQGLGAVHSRLALNSVSDRATRLRHWHLAQSWYEKAIPHIERGMPIETLNHVSRRPYDDAVAGLSRSKAEIEKLAAAPPVD